MIVSWDGVEAQLRKLGHKLPEDLGFASLDLDENNLHISGTNENNFYIGQKAIDVLIGLLHRGEKGIPPIPTRLLVESTWNPGTTLRLQSSAGLVRSA